MPRRQEDPPLALVAWLTAPVLWLHANIVHPLVDWWSDVVLGVWEESLLGVVREGFDQTSRTLNALSGWILSVCQGSFAYNQVHRTAWGPQPWNAWWRSDHDSTFNALVARSAGGGGGGAGGAGPATQRRPPDATAAAAAAAAAALPPTAGGFLRQRRSHAPAPPAHTHPPQPPSPPRGDTPPLAKDHTRAAAAAAGRWGGWGGGGGGDSGGDEDLLATDDELQPAPSPTPPQTLNQGEGGVRGEGGGGGGGEAAAAAAETPSAAAAAALLERTTVLLSGGVAALSGGVSALWEEGGAVAGAAEAATKLAGGVSAYVRSAGATFFEQPPGWAVHELVRRQGLLEDLRLLCELCVDRCFRAARAALRLATATRAGGGAGGGGASPAAAAAPSSAAVAALSPAAAAAGGPGGGDGGGGGSPRPCVRRSKTLSCMPPPPPAADAGEAEGGAEGAGARAPPHPLARARSGPAMAEVTDLSSAAQVIRLAGYPLEVHEVVTPDGYVLRMERLPAPSARDAVFFVHGILDTSLTWVSQGVTGSMAFAAWDRGFDVWLGSTRCNPPHAATDPSRRGSRYWAFTNNEVGLVDMAAQLDHLHATKCAELASSCEAAGVGAPPTHTPAAPAPPTHTPSTPPAPTPFAAAAGEGPPSAPPQRRSAAGAADGGGGAAAAAAAEGGGGAAASAAQRRRAAAEEERRGRGSGGGAPPAPLPRRRHPPPPPAAAMGAALLPSAPPPPSRGPFPPGGCSRAPYRLRCVAHSLGGMAMLTHLTARGAARQPHHVRRLILLTPAGFHIAVPPIFKPVIPPAAAAVRVLRWLWPAAAMQLHLPTALARLLMFKFSLDTNRLPAVGELLRALARALLGGDRSAWERALQMPHYATRAMPSLSLGQFMHFVQIYRSRRFQLYDHGSPSANAAAYGGLPHPPSVPDLYPTLRGLPVHLVAGAHDGIIPPSNVAAHRAALEAAGVETTWRVFDYGHMDFTFAAKDELSQYVLSLLCREC